MRPSANPASPGGDDERPVGSGEHLAECVDGAPVGVGGARVVGEIVIERQVDHAVGGLRPGAQAREVLEIAPVDLCSRRLDSLSGRIGTGQAEDLVACGDELRNDG